MASTHTAKPKRARGTRAGGGNFGYTPGKALDELRPIPSSVRSHTRSTQPDGEAHERSSKGGSEPCSTR
ncbi:hypothetical protein GCM10023353_10850 [Tomitella cavernea]|uniref:Uncharacterized protein n=1 Tax=Tomitella cavernea TaxID=1387982 RepID=A0ABP9CDK7_9ACTN